MIASSVLVAMRLPSFIGLIFADGREQHVVLALIHVVLLAAPGPVGLAFYAGYRAAADGEVPSVPRI